MIIGKSLSRKLKLPSLKLKADSSKCVGCKICDKSCVMSLNVIDMVKAGTIDSNECILCGKCVDNCPKSVIKYTFGK